MNVQTDNARLPFEISATIVRALRRYILVVLVAGVIALWSAPSVRADPAAPATAATTASATGLDRARISREYLIKAAILYNLTRFVTWPDAALGGPGVPVRICILGRDPFGRALESLQDKQIGSRKLVISAITEVDHAAACHVLFVSASEEGRLAAILDAVSPLPVLTVADIGGFATAGGIVGLTQVDDRSRLEVNVGAANRAGVKLSSNLLRLAVTVDKQTVQLKVVPEN